MRWDLRNDRTMRVALLLLTGCVTAGAQGNGCPFGPKMVVAEQWESCGEAGVQCAAGTTCLVYGTPAATPDGGEAGWCEIPCTSGVSCPESQHCAVISDGESAVCVAGVAPGSACGQATPLGGLPPLVVEGNTLDHDALYEPTQCAGFGAPGTPEVVFAFKAQLTAEYRFWLDPNRTWFDSVLYAASTCPPTPQTCLGIDDDWLHGGEEIERLVHAGETILLFVDGNAQAGVPGNMAPGGGHFALLVTTLTAP